jgi:hypothetical protein
VIRKERIIVAADPAAGGTGILAVLRAGALRRAALWIAPESPAILHAPSEERLVVRRIPGTAALLTDTAFGDLERTDWERYLALNRRLAYAVSDEAQTPDPVVLVHAPRLARIPRLLREYLPQAWIVSLWDAAWPDAAGLRRSPWSGDVLRGLLGSNVIAFAGDRECADFMIGARDLISAALDAQRCSIEYWHHRSFVRALIGPEGSIKALSDPATFDERAVRSRSRRRGA